MNTLSISSMFLSTAGLVLLAAPAAAQLPGTIDLADVGGAVPGAVFHGIDESDQSGYSVSSAGDVNGDGLDDLLIGALRNDSGYMGVIFGESFFGESYLVYGSASLTGDNNLASADVTFKGIDADDLASRVSAAGDVNGDGLDDVLISAFLADPGGLGRAGAGQTYLIYGKAGLAGDYNLAGADVTFNGIDGDDFSGDSISSAGDVNGDGLADLLIGATGANPVGIDDTGQAYLIYGSASLSGSFDLASADVIFSGIDGSDGAGGAVSSAGDVNGDGLADLLIAAPGSDPGGIDRAGETYLVYGRADLAGSYDLASADVTFNGIDAVDFSGASISSAGDVNGDGLADLLIGALHADPRGVDRAGETYLVYGRADLAGSYDLANADVTLYGIEVGDRSGQSISSAGDVNGDGFADLLIGAPEADPEGRSRAGQTYLMYGSAGLSGSFDLASADVTFNGIDAEDFSGRSVSSAGDVNGDGLADLLIGARWADQGGFERAGETYLIYGQAVPVPEPHTLALASLAACALATHYRLGRSRRRARGTAMSLQDIRPA